jgi:hypothetical protein
MRTWVLTLRPTKSADPIDPHVQVINAALNLSSATYPCLPLKDLRAQLLDNSVRDGSCSVVSLILSCYNNLSDHHDTPTYDTDLHTKACQSLKPGTIQGKSTIVLSLPSTPNLCQHSHQLIKLNKHLAMLIKIKPKCFPVGRERKRTTKW